MDTVDVRVLFFPSLWRNHSKYMQECYALLCPVLSPDWFWYVSFSPKNQKRNSIFPVTRKQISPYVFSFRFNKAKTRNLYLQATHHDTLLHDIDSNTLDGRTIMKLNNVVEIVSSVYVIKTMFMSLLNEY